MFPLLVSGKAIIFDQTYLDHMLTEYSEEEQEAIRSDLAVVDEICFKGKSAREDGLLYIATAGAPGACKSTILEHILAEEPRFANTVYIDPDQRGLKFMVHTYYSRSMSLGEIAKAPSFAECQRVAYSKWRGGSNFIATSLLEKSVQGHYDIAYGTTMTGPNIARLFSLLKGEGYHITLVLCGCEDSVRFKSIHHRNTVQGFCQTTPDDEVAKGRWFPIKMPIYFEFADELRVYWSDSFDTDEILAAVFSTEGLRVVNQEAYDRFIAKYERDRIQINLEDTLDLPSWSTLESGWDEKNQYRDKCE